MVLTQVFCNIDLCAFSIVVQKYLYDQSPQYSRLKPVMELQFLPPEDNCFVCVKQKKRGFIVSGSLLLKLPTLALQKTKPEGKVTAGEDSGRMGRKAGFLPTRICCGHERFMQ